MIDLLGKVLTRGKGVNGRYAKDVEAVVTVPDWAYTTDSGDDMLASAYEDGFFINSELALNTAGLAPMRHTPALTMNTHVLTWLCRECEAKLHERWERPPTYRRHWIGQHANGAPVEGVVAGADCCVQAFNEMAAVIDRSPTLRRLRLEDMSATPRCVAHWCSLHVPMLTGSIQRGITAWVAAEDHPFISTLIELIDAHNGPPHMAASLCACLRVEAASAQRWFDDLVSKPTAAISSYTTLVSVAMESESVGINALISDPNFINQYLAMRGLRA